MKVDILGRGPIPGLNSIAPSYNADLSLPELEKIVKIGALRPVVAGTNIAIHRRNLNEIFKVYSSAAEDVPAVKTEEAPKKAAKKKAAEPIQQVETPVTEKELEPVVETPVEEPKEAVEVNENEEGTLEATEEDVEAVEETTAEEHQNYSSKKNKKKNR